MEWSKIKTIIILILVCVNVFLLSLVVVREGKSARYQEEARTGAVALLEKNGISFLPGRVPQDMAFSAGTVIRDRTWEQVAAEALLGATERRDEYDGLRVTYQSDRGSAEFSNDGRFRIGLTPGARPVEAERWRADSEEAMGAMGLTGEFLAREERTDGTVLLWRQTWQGVPLFSCTVSFYYRDGMLQRVEGKNLAGAESAVQGEKPLRTATVLVRFLAGINEGGFVCSQIVDMTPGYLDGGGKPVKLIPVWYITTDTGAYYLDALTGTVSQAAE